MKTLASILAIAFTVGTLAQERFVQLAVDSSLQNGWITNLTLADGELAEVVGYSSYTRQPSTWQFTPFRASIRGFNSEFFIGQGAAVIGPATITLIVPTGGQYSSTALAVLRVRQLPVLKSLKVQQSPDLTNWTDAATVPVPNIDGFWRLQVAAPK